MHNIQGIYALDNLHAPISICLPMNNTVSESKHLIGQNLGHQFEHLGLQRVRNESDSLVIFPLCEADDTFASNSFY